MKRYFLNIGGITIVRGKAEVTTILGSCISIILIARSKNISAVCHAQIPQKFHMYNCYDTCPKRCHMVLNESDDNRYLTCALGKMISWFEKNGIFSNYLEAMVIGGGAILKIKRNNESVGLQNEKKAIDLLKNYHIPIIKMDVGGDKSRKMKYYSENYSLSVTYS